MLHVLGVCDVWQRESRMLRVLGVCDVWQRKRNV